MSQWRAAIAAALSVVALILLASQPNSGRAQVPAAEKPIGILLAAGDISSCGAKEWHSYANRTAELIRRVIKEAGDATPAIPVRVLALGDLAYGEGTPEQFECFKTRWTGFDDVLLPIPGNHEYLSPDAAPYFAYFENNPFVNPKEPNGEKDKKKKGKKAKAANKGYFAVNFPRADGPWRLIGLNAHIQGKGAMKTQLEWLEKRLDIGDEANRQNCVLAFWHPPTFSSGRHGHDYKTEPNAPLTKKRPMQIPFNMLYRHGASVVLAGHEHSYEQFSPQDAEGKSVDDGIRLFVVGTGGSLLTQDEYIHMAPNSEGLYGRTKLKNGSQGVLQINLFENKYTWEFLSIDENTKLALKATADDCRMRKQPKT
jgi:acid phosphatase type 7